MNPILSAVSLVFEEMKVMQTHENIPGFFLLNQAHNTRKFVIFKLKLQQFVAPEGGTPYPDRTRLANHHLK